MSKLKSKILVVDDNAGIRSALKILLPMRFAEVELIASPKVLMETMRTFKPDVVLLDMNFETDINTGNEGLFWLSELKRDFPEVEVVLFTAYADIALAVEGMKRGAFDFVVKPECHADNALGPERGDAATARDGGESGSHRCHRAHHG